MRWGARSVPAMLSALTSTAPYRPAVAPPPAIEVRGLRKCYGPVTAVEGLDLRIERGELYALLGPNGAGKTTTVEILDGFRTPTAGHVRVLGVDPSAAPIGWRERVGIVLQESEPDPGLTVAQTLELYAGYHESPRGVVDTLALAGLEAQAARPATRLSGGQRRRLDFALAIIGNPDVIFLDEPTTGFDPAARRAAWDVIDALRATGVTVFLTTHYMDEAERLADRIGVIVGGRLVAEGSPQTLGGRDRGDAAITFTLPAGLGAAELPGDLVQHASVNGRRLRLTTHRPLAAVEQLAAWARDRHVDLVDLEIRRDTLEDVYLRLTDRSDER
jgi:ABC-2 type transport system ATP-binding protein